MVQVGAPTCKTLNSQRAWENKAVYSNEDCQQQLKNYYRSRIYLSHGNPQVILCERGIRTFETETRNTLALASVPWIKELSHLPIIVDPSHATEKIPHRTNDKAAIACGADGFIVETSNRKSSRTHSSKLLLNNLLNDGKFKTHSSCN